MNGRQAACAWMANPAKRRVPGWQILVRGKLAQHVLQDASVLVVEDLLRCVDAPLHSPDKCLFKKSAKPRTCGRVILHVL